MQNIPSTDTKTKIELECNYYNYNVFNGDILVDDIIKSKFFDEQYWLNTRQVGVNNYGFSYYILSAGENSFNGSGALASDNLITGSYDCYGVRPVVKIKRNVTINDLKISL